MIELMPRLLPGDEIRIISTARKINPSEIAGALDFIKSNGFNTVIGNNLYQSYNQVSGTDDQRFQDLQDAIDAPNVKAIWLARGGYGTHRIIDQISFKALKKNPKWIIGYSDVTVLHLALNKLNIQSLHATMPINYTDQSRESFEDAIDILKGTIPDYTLKSHPSNQTGFAKGKLIGGNLSILYSLTGSSIVPDMKDSILFIEDLDEYLYHLDRMMMNLKLSGVLKNINGLIVGGMSEMNDNTIPFGKNAIEIISEHASKLGIPLCFGFPAGHQFENRPLILGREIELNVGAEEVKINY
jgi:muramoyltetrapeptide carboxypeptidase